MVDIFDCLYASIKNRNLYLTKWRCYSFFRFTIRIAANLILPIYFQLTRRNRKYALQKKKNTNVEMIVSLTSFPKRINRVWMAIETILRQKQKPDRVILWLSINQFSSLNQLPKNLLKQRSRGLEIQLREGDIGSHKKYFYALQEFPNSIVVTVDDDIFYPSNTTFELLKWHNNYPNSVIARYGLKIKLKNNDLAPYKEWNESYKQESPDYNIFFGSGGGTLFPPFSLYRDTFESDIFISISKDADDVWLNTMCRLNNTKIFKINKAECSLLPILNRNNTTLASKNVQQNLNDKQLSDVRNYFKTKINTDPFYHLFESTKSEAKT